MLYLLRRHPLPICARFEHSLVLIYAVPSDVLAPLVPPGLQVDTWNSLGFLAAAFVQTRELRPDFLPRLCGRDFFLAGYRIFVRHRTREGRTLRGLRILRSDADSRAMVFGGNLLTHYNYRHCRAEIESGEKSLSIRVRTPDQVADVDLVADLKGPSGFLPSGSPFPDERAARRFAGPMPFTFDYEPQTHSIVRIRGVRQAWDPRLVPVDVRTLGFIEHGSLAACGARLASAFHVADIAYRWERGIVDPLRQEAA